jgi:MFS family permease
MMGMMTISYGIAQIIGPAITGWLGTKLGSYSGGLYLAAGMMGLGTLLLFALKNTQQREALAK